MSTPINVLAYLEQTEGTNTVERRIAQMVSWVSLDPEKVEMAITSGMSKVMIEVIVHGSGAGKVIGQRGMIINAIRTIVKAMVDETDPIYDVLVLDDKAPSAGSRG